MPLHNSGAVGIEDAGKHTVSKITNRNTFHTIVKTFGTLKSDKTGTDDQYVAIFVDCFFKCKGIVKCHKTELFLDRIKSFEGRNERSRTGCNTNFCIRQLGTIIQHNIF